MTVRAWFPHERADAEIAERTAEIRRTDDPGERAIRALAMMVKHAPSYGVVVLPFAVAHQEACEALAELQAQGNEDAR